MVKIKVLRVFFPLLIFLNSCGPGTFIGTWTKILDPGNSSPLTTKIDPETIKDSEPIISPPIKTNKNYFKVVGVPNRDRNIVMMNDTGGQVGFSVVSEDINNDGYDDIILGAPDSDGVMKETTTSGWVYIVFGKNKFSQAMDLKHEVDVSFWAGRGGGRNRLGHALASSDINGDGIKDLIIGAPHFNGKNNQRVHSGAIFVVYGKSKLRRINNLEETADLIILGAHEGDLAGFSISSGNINGDKKMDLIIGAPGSRNKNSSETGAAYILFGRKSFPKVIDLSKHHNGHLVGSDGAAKKLSFLGNRADQAGYSVLSADVNSDGLDDVLIGAPFADGYQNKGEDSGEVYIVLGRTKFPKRLELRREANSIIYGSKKFEYSGKQLASGDMNGDGIADVLISSPGAKIKSKKKYSTGIVFGVPGRKIWPRKLYSGKRGNKAFVSHYKTYGENYESTMSGDNILDFGAGLAAIDLNGDKMDDLVIGVPGAPKGKFDFGAGSINSFIAKKNKRKNFPSRVFQPTRLGSSESLGKSIAVGDINGDGNKDLLVGAPGMFRSKTRGVGGGAYIIFGSSISY